MRLLDFLFPPRTDEALLRGIRDDEFLAFTKPQLAPETRPGTAVLLPFNEPAVRAAIHEAKYQGSERAFSLLALVLADYLRDADLMAKRGLVMVPVPLGKKRLKERGYNQAEEVARRAFRSFSAGEPRPSLEPDLLERVRETGSQVTLPRHKREENMRGAFSATPRLRRTSAADFANATFVILDDVLTTGATLQAAIDALRAAGVGSDHILPIALAH